MGTITEVFWEWTIFLSLPVLTPKDYRMLIPQFNPLRDRIELKKSRHFFLFALFWIWQVFPLKLLFVCDFFFLLGFWFLPLFFKTELLLLLCISLLPKVSFSLTSSEIMAAKSTLSKNILLYWLLLQLVFKYFVYICHLVLIFWKRLFIYRVNISKSNFASCIRLNHFS